ncbi:MAG TPA: type II secretion system protein GspF, partial [Rhodoferax sp.]|nr:type II secretion system protein GspF [Rhodoferax sp.]
MPAYSFEALSANGETRKGIIDADSARAARGLLRAQALVPLAVEAVMAGNAGADGASGTSSTTLWSKRVF